MLSDEVKVGSFTEFVEASELRLRQSLVALFGVDAGRDAAAEAFAYAWEHWDRVAVMDNSLGYLYRVGQTSGRRAAKSRSVGFPVVDDAALPWVEPGLPEAMRRLPDRQRQVVFLLHAYDWSMAEVAELLDVSKATVQTHSDRAMRRLRRWLKVDA